jgi:hypothetical protein
MMPSVVMVAMVVMVVVLWPLRQQHHRSLVL